MKKDQTQTNLPNIEIDDNNQTNRTEEYISHISHEMRTPLNGIIGLAKLLEEENLSDKSKTYINSILQSGYVLLDLVNELLDRVEFSNSEFKISSHEFCIYDIVKNCVEILSNIAANKRLDVNYYVSPLIPSLLNGDSKKLRQILFNLLSNAIKYTHEGGVGVSIYPYKEDGNKIYIRMDVIDTGIGLNPSEKEKLFAPFERFDQDTIQGTGIGLVITKQIINKLGGEIEIFSHKNQGSVFSVVLPFEKMEESKNIDRIFEGEKIALCTNSFINFELLKKQLFDLGTEEVILAKEGDIDNLYSNKDIITFFDYDDNNEVLEKFLTKTSKIILLVNDYERDVFKNFQEKGLKSFLVKPVRNESLVKQLEKIAANLHDQTEQAAPKNNAFEKINEAANASLAENNSFDINIPKNPAIKIEQNSNELVPNLDKTQKIKVLLVEDNQINAILAKELLKKLNVDYEHAANGQIAIDLLGKNNFDLVLMDMHMPVLDGLTATKKIRESSKNFANITIIALTANASAKDREKCMDAGMNDFISKPIDPELLAEKITQIVKKSN